MLKKGATITITITAITITAITTVCGFLARMALRMEVTLSLCRGLWTVRSGYGGLAGMEEDMREGNVRCSLSHHRAGYLLPVSLIPFTFHSRKMTTLC